MDQEIERLLQEAGDSLAGAGHSADVEAIRVKYLGRKGILGRYFSLLGEADRSPEEKTRLGQKLNAFKQQLERQIQERQQALQQTAAPDLSFAEDFTLPGYFPSAGRLHPITLTIDQILKIFRSLGFSVVEGPEVETEYYNFEALNIPADHPSRESFDTFYLASEKPSPTEPRALLRSHTSPMQVRFMETHKPPFRIVVPGRVFRPDAVDASHCFQFHQVEGLVVGPDLTFGDLKGLLTAWAQGMFGGNARLRFRPHYFPFTEPSAEADLACVFCDGKGCRVCGQKGWLEILGFGMVHPAVFKAAGVSSGTVGLAFGMGVERIAMLRYGIEDIRLFFENDLRFLRQFP